MAAIFKLRRGTTASPALVDGELFLNYTTGTIQFASGSSNPLVSNLLPLGKSVSGDIILNGNINTTGDITGSSLLLSGDITANDINARNVSLSGNIFLGDGAGGDTVEVNASFSGSLLPETSDVYNIGSNLFKYKELHTISASIENVSLPGTGILSSSLQDFDTFSGSVDTQLNFLQIFESNTLIRLSSIETFTQSIDSRVDELETTFSSSVDSRLDLLETFSSSEYQTDSSSFDSRLDTIEGSFSTSVDLRLDNAEWTGSNHEGRITSIEGYSASLDSRLDDLEATGSDHESRIDEIETTFSTSVDLRLDNAEWTGSDQESRLDVIETTFSSSVDLRLDLLETFSSSEYQTDSSSFDLRLDDLEVTGSDHESRIDSLEFFSSSEYQADSSSVDSRLDDAEWTGSNQEGRIIDLESTGSDHELRLDEIETTFSSSVDLRLDNLELTGSDHESRLDTLEGPFSQSVDSRLVDTEWTGSDHESRLDTIEGPFSSSLDARINSLNLYTQSNDLRVDDLELTGSDHESRLDTIEGPLSSSIDNQLNTIQSYTASLKNAIEVSGQNLTVFGDLVVEGTTTTINTQELLIEDKLLAIGSGSTTSTDADGGGFFISGADASILWNHLDQTLDFNTKVSSSVGFKGDGSELINIPYTGIELDGSGIVSGSSQIDLTQTTNYVSGIKTRLNAEGVFSSSVQVNADDITNFDSNVKDKLTGDMVHSGSYLGTATTANLTEGGFNLYYTNDRVKTKLNVEGVISSSAQLENIFLEIDGDDVVSGSSQIDLTQTQNYTSFSSSLDERLVNAELTGSDHETRLDLLTTFSESLDAEFLNTNGDNVVSGSSQIDLTQTTNYESGILDRLNVIGVLSGSDQVTSSLDLKYLEILGDSVVSGSSQIDLTQTTNYISGIKSRLNADNVISGSSQVTESLDSRYLEINGDSVVSGSSQIDLTQTSNYEIGIKSRLDFETVISGSSQVDLNLVDNFVPFSSSLDSRLDSLEGDQHTHTNKTNLDSINQNLSTTNTPSFNNLQLSSLNTLGTGEVNAVFSGSSGTLGTRALGTAAFLNYSQSISQEDDNVIGTAGAMKRYIDEQLLIIGAGDITKITAGDGISGGADSGEAIVNLDTASAHFETGVSTAVSGLSSSIDARFIDSEGRLDSLELFSSSLDDDFVNEVELGLATASLLDTIDTKLNTSSFNSFTESYTINSASVDTRLDDLELFSSSLDKEDPLTFNDTATIDLVRTGNVITANAIGGLVSGSDQVTQSLDLRYLEINGDNVFSSSEQVDADFITNFDNNVKDKLNADGVISGSSQVSADQTEGWAADVKTQLDANTVISGSSQVSADQTDGWVDDVKTQLNSNTVISGSSQVQFNAIDGNPMYSGSSGGLQYIAIQNQIEYILPESAGYTSLGHPSYPFKALYVSNNSIHIGDTIISRDDTTGNIQFVDSGSGSPLSAEVDFTTIVNKPTLVSGSSQIDVQQTTNYDELVNISGSQTIVGTKTFNDIVVNGTGSFAYIQSVTGSAKIIGDAYVVVNNNTPSERFAGIAVYDSGSTGVTASLEFDGELNDWFYEYSDDNGVTTDHGVVLFGPEYSTKGNPTYPTNNRIQKGNGGHHLLDSNITDTGTLITLGSNTVVDGTLVATGTTLVSESAQIGMGGDLEGTAANAQIKTGVITNTEVSPTAGIVYTKLNLGGSSIISGSDQITLIGDVTGPANANTVEKIQGVSITSGEATQLANINTTTISSTQWGYVGALNQGLTETSNVKFGIISGSAIHSTSTVTAEGDVIAYSTSDQRLKDEITPIENSLQKINQIGGYSFVWNEKQDIYKGKDYGVIAQEIENILPELVETRKDGYKAVKYDRIVSLLIEGVKELSKEVSELKEKIGK